MDRRQFFKRSAHKTGESIVKHLDEQAERRALRWIRPPHALDELEFLLACTRCGDCIDACPHQVIFPLPAKLGAQVVATPALDLLNKGCHLCADWPCVTACEAGALKLPDRDTAADTAPDSIPNEYPMPRLAVASIDTQQCLPYQGPECGACDNSCPVPGALVWQANKPSIVAELCPGCGCCREACVLEPKAVSIVPL